MTEDRQRYVAPRRPGGAAAAVALIVAVAQAQEDADHAADDTE